MDRLSQAMEKLREHGRKQAQAGAEREDSLAAELAASNKASTSLSKELEGKKQAYEGIKS